MMHSYFIPVVYMHEHYFTEQINLTNTAFLKI